MTQTVFFDVDTQVDFLYPSGALAVPGAARIVDNIAKLNRWAGARGIPLISTTDAHSENDAEFRTWPAHCVAGTLGQRKPEATLLDRRVLVPSAPAEVSIAGASQIIIEKQALDCFTNLNLTRILRNIEAERFVVYGVVTEYCVRCAALGLLKLGVRVELVSDAIQTLKQEDGARTIEEITTAGGYLTTVPQICD